MFEISVKKSFSSAHSLRNYKGKCESIHGHNWIVVVKLCGEKLSKDGMLYDFSKLKRALNKIFAALDHKNLNETAPFDKINPSAENIAHHIYDETKKNKDIKKSGAFVKKVSVWESESSRADYYE